MESHFSKLVSSNTIHFKETEVAIVFATVTVVLIKIFGIWSSILFPEA